MPKAKKSAAIPAGSTPRQELLPRKMGRPSSYHPEIVDELCRRMAAGELPSQICKDDHMPCRDTLREWRAANAEFSALYARAYDLLCEYWAEDLITIGDDATNDWMERDLRNGKGELVGTLRVVDQENINRSRLRCDNRKWLLSKLMRHKYGDRMDVNHGGEIGVTQTAEPDDLESNSEALYQDMLLIGKK